MSLIYNSPASSRTQSVKSSSRASRLRTLSIKSGVTMMTTNSVEIETDVFRENYFKTQNEIEQYKSTRDELESELRKLQVEFEFKQRKIRDSEFNYEVRKSILDERESHISDDEIRGLPELIHQQAILEQKKESKYNQIDDIKYKIETIYKNISKVLDQTVELSTVRNDIPLLKTECEGLISAIQMKTNRIMELEEISTKQTNELNRLRAIESEHNKEKDLINEKYGNLENRRLEAIRTLADPIESTEYEEKALAELEEDVTNIEERFENIKKSDERDDTIKILAQIEKTEQQNIKKKAMLENRAKVLANQKKFRERRLKDDQRRIEQQKETFERLKQEIAEAEKIRKTRETKDAEEDETIDQSIPYKRYVPKSKIRDDKDLAEQIKQFEQENQERLNKIIGEISQLEAKFKNEREIEQEKWKRFMRRIDTYTKRLSKKEIINNSISEIDEQNEELREKLKTLIQTKEQLARRKHVNLTHRNKKSEEFSVYEQYANALRQKQIDIEQSLDNNKQRKKDIEKQKFDIVKLEEAVNEKQKKVNEVEVDLAKYKVLMSNAVDNLNTSQATLEDAITTIEAKV